MPARTPTMPASRLEALPAELLVLVAEYLPRRGLWACCRACKTLQNVAKPLLYQNVHVKSSRPMPLGRGLLDRKNTGLNFVRDLQIAGSSPGRAESLRCLLLLLPKDHLKTLKAEAIAIDDVLFSTIFTTQGRLENVALGTLSFGTLDFINSGFIEDHTWASLQTLEIPEAIRSTRDLNIWRAIISSATSLKNLVVRVHRTITGSNSTPLQDSLNKRGALFSTLFPASLEEAQGEKLNLRSLTLARSSLILAQETITSAVDFSKLVELRLENCPMYDYLLRALADSFSVGDPALRSFSLTTSDLDCDEGLDSFLCSFGGLRKLYIRVTSEEFSGFDTSCLETHKHSLEQLAIALSYRCGCDDSTPTGTTSSLRVSAKLPQLRQLCLTVPLTLGKSPPDEEERHRDMIRSLLRHPTMQTLRIFNWPDLADDLTRGSLITGYLYELQLFLENHIIKPLLDTNPECKFPALIIGRAGAFCYQDLHTYIEDAVWFRIGNYRGADVFRQRDTIVARGTIREAEESVPELEVAEFGR